MKSFIRRMHAQGLGKGVARRAQSRLEARRRIDLLGPERLEDRTLLSITASLSSGVLDVQLSAAGDQALIAPTTSGISVSGTGYTAQTFAGVTAMVVQGANSASQDVPNQGVTFGGSGGTITLDAAAGTAALNVSGVTSVIFTDVTVDASSGDVNVAASEMTSAAAMQATSKPDVSVSVTGATIKADNVQLTASASSSFTNSAPAGGALNALGVAAEVADLEPSASVTVQGPSTTIAVNGTGGNVTIAADAGVTITSSSTVGTTFAGNAANPVDAAIAESIVNSSAVAQVGGGSTVSAGTGSGTVSITSSNTTTVTTKVDGAGAVGGATGAVTLDSSTSQASVSGGSTVSGDTVDVTASTVNTATTSATSMATGAGPNSAVQNILAGNVDPGYLASATPSAPDPGKKTSPAETALSAGLPLGIAGAVAVTKFTPTTQAYVDSSTITAGGTIDIGASADNNATTSADGEATTSNSNLSVGVGVAISDAIASNTATVSSTTGTTTLTAPMITVGATSPAASSTDAHAISATATSGASGTNVGLAGALALNIVSNTTEAAVPSGSTVAMVGDVTFNAQNDVVETATAQPPVGFAGGSGGGALGIGASVALNIAGNTTLAELQDQAQLTGAHNLTFTAGSADAISTNAIAGSSGGTVSLSPSVGISVVNDTTDAQVGAPDAAGDPLVISGALSATATHTSTTSTPTGAGAGAGSAVSAGVAIALAFVNDQTTATTGRSIDARGGGVSFEADGSAASLVSANATATGGPTKSQESKEPSSGPADSSEAASGSDTADPNSVDGQNAQARDFANNESTLTDSKGKSVNAGDTKGDAKTPAAQTSDGSLTVAAAVAVNIVNSNADATIPAGLTITANGPVTVTANNDTGDPANLVNGDTANAWGSAAGTAKVGIGAAVALNLVNASTQATIGASTIHADGVTANAGMLGTSPMNVYGAVAISGAGAGDIGVAGSVAVNIVNNSTEALIGTGAAVDAGGGDVSVTALNNATDTTLAQPAGAATGSTLGIGASLALNVINETTEAEIQDSAAVTNPGNVTVTAASAQTILAWGQNGAAGGVAIGAGIAIAIVGDSTTAEVGADSSQPLDLSGNLTIGASGSFTVNSLADAASSPGATLGLGASVAVNVAQDSFTAELGRNVNAGGTVSVTDAATSSSQATAVASEQGASPSGTDSSSGSSGTADQETQNQSSFAHNEGGSDSPNVAAPPTSNSELSSPSSAAGGDSGGSKGSTKIGIAAAVAVNVLTTSTVASIDNGLTVTARGALAVGTTNQSGALALADGRATNNQNSIGAAVSLNVANVTNKATIGSTDSISAAGVSVTAIMPAGQVNDFSTQGLGVAIGTQVGVAGSAGINVISITTTASIGSGSVVNSSAGLTVQAAEDETLQNIAFTLAVGSDVGAGAAINVNVLNNTTNAYLDSGVSANAADATQVTAESSLAPSQDPVPNSPADTIVATGTLEAGKTDVGAIDGSVLGVLGGSANTPFAGEPVTGAGVPIGTVITKTDTKSFTANLTFGSNVITSDDSIFLDSLKSPKVGDTVSGPGIANGSTIQSLVTNSLGTTITLSLPVIANGSAPLGATDLVLSQAATASGPVTLVETPVDIVSKALSSLHPTNFAAGAGASSGGAGIAGSFIVNVINQTTHAYIGSGDQINTLAGTAGNVPANADEGVTVSATETMNIVDWAGAIGAGDDAGIGAALDVNIVTENDSADIASTARVDAAQNVEITAGTDGTFKSITAAAGIGDSAGIAGAASIEVLSPTTSAFIGNSATVNAAGDLLVQASRQATISTVAGQLSASGDASVGAAVSTIVNTANTQASISSSDNIKAQGSSGTIPVLVGDAAGDTTPFSGVAVVAATVQNIQAVAVGGAVSGGVGVAGSMAVNVLSDTTTADIGAGAVVVATDGKPGTGPGVMVTAADFLTLLSTAGALAAGSDAGLGAGVDADSITRNTQAYIATAGVTADGDVLVQAKSSGNLTSITAAIGASGDVAIVGSAGVYVLNITTRAFIGDDPSNPTAGATTVQAGGSILVAASESTVLDLLSGNLSGSGDLSVGAAASVPVITKTTEAFIGAGAALGALGLGNAINAETGQFTISYAAYGTSPGEVAPPSEKANLTNSSNSSNNDLTSPRLGQERIATPDTEAIHGLAVTAVNADSLQGVGVTGGASGSVAVNLSGSVAVLTNHTDAYIGSGAQINSNNTGAAADQSVLVASGNDTSFLGIAGSVAISGDLSVAPGVVVLVVNNTTTASIDDGVSVAALGDVAVVAHSGGDVLAIAAAAAVSGTAAGGGSVAYVGINDTTQANIGDSATSAGAGAQVNAGGSVLVDATDTTVAYLVTGSLAIGIDGAGIGGAVSIVDLGKTTNAFIGNYATVDARGGGSGLDGIYDGVVNKTTGGFDTQSGFQGVSVQAATSENVTNVAAAGAAGLYAGLAGGVSIELFNSDTTAYVGNDASINTAGLDVAAVNQASNFSFGGGLGGGIAGIAGGVDVGSLKNSTQAYIGNNAGINATGNVGVYALSNDSVQTYALGAAVGVVGLVGSVSVWSIGVPYSAGYTDGNSSDGTVQAVPVSGITGSSSGAEGQTGGASSMVGTLASSKNNGAAGNTQYISGIVGGNQTGVTGSIVGDPVADAINSTAVPTGTVAFIGQGVTVTADNVSVLAQSEVSYTGLVGGLAAGVVGIGGSVAIVSIQGNTQAYIDRNSIVNATGNVTVNAALVSDTARGTAFAGTAGIVAIGAQVVDIQDTSTESASLNSGVTIPNAAQVQVTASSDRSLTALAIGGDIGGVVIGVGVAIADATGGPSASIGSTAEIGQNHTGTVGSVDVNAAANDTVAAKSYGVSAGSYGATAVFADASSSPNVQATVGNNAAITTTGAVQVTAQDTPNVSSKAFGATIALSVGVGAAISQANASGTTSSNLGQGDAISAASIDVSASRNEDANNDPTAQSSATAGAGGVLAGVNATSSQATAGGTVEAGTGSSVVLRAGAASIQATNQSLQAANSTGVAVGGLLAIGADVSSASSDVTTSASLGTGANVVVAGTLGVLATGTDENDASTTAGSGGLIAGDASVGKSSDTSTVSTTVAGDLAASNVVIGATNNSVFTPQVDSVNAALAGASGALAKNDDNTSAGTTVADGTRIVGVSAANITAQNTFTEKLPTSGSTVSAGAGGLANGTAALSETTLTGNADVTIGGSVNIDVENPVSAGISNDGIFLIASSVLHTNDQVSLSSGGAIEGAGTDSSLTATLNNNVTTSSTAANPDTFVTNQNIGIGTYSTVNAATTSEAHTWGVLGAVASSSAETTVTSNQNVTLGPDTNLTAAQTINLSAGHDPTPGAPPTSPMSGDADAQSYVRGLVAIPPASATSNVTSNTSLTVGAGDQIQSGENTNLMADNTTPSATAEGIGHGYQLGFIPTTDGSSNPTALATSSVTMDGSIAAGIFHQLDITVPNDQTAGGFYGNTLVANGATTSLQTAPSSSLISGPSFAAFTASYDPYFNPYNTIANAPAGAFPDPGEVTALEDAVYHGAVGAIVLGPLFAAGGDVTVNAGSLQGSGSIAAYGGPTINITNNSPDYLVLSSINVPFEPGGQVFLDGGAAAPATIAVTQSGANARPVVNIQETYNSPVPSSNSNGPSVFATATMDSQGNVSLDPSGFMDNEGGQFAVTVADGSFVQAGALNANQVNITTTNGITALSNPDGLSSNAGSPPTDWSQVAYWPNGYDPYTNGNTPSDLAAVYVAYVANVLYNSGGSYTDNQSFTAALIGHAGETPYSLDPGQYDSFGYGSWPASASSLVFFGADAPWLDGAGAQDTNASASALSPAGSYYTISGSANDGYGQDSAEGIFPMVPVESIPTTTAAGYPTVNGTLTSGSETVSGLSSTKGLVSGEEITGTGIQPGTTIQVGTTSFVGQTTQGSDQVYVYSGLSGLAVGDTVTGPGFLTGATIQKVDPNGIITLSISPFFGFYTYFTATSLTLSKPATASGPENFTIGTGSSINADGVFINARYVDINEPINVGRSGNESLSLPASLDSTIALDQAFYAAGFDSTTAGDAPGYYTLPSTTVSGGDTPITAQYDALTGQIVVSQVSAASGGFISLDGAIMSTSTFGEINVNSDLGQVTVDNQTSYPIVISDVSASKSAGSTSLTGVDIIDTNQPAATEQTLYVYQPGNIIDEYRGTAGETEQQLQQSSPAAVIQGNSTSYTPEAGLRWEWQLQTTMQQPNLYPGSSSSAGWGFDLTDVNGLTANNPWYYLTTPNGSVYDGTSQPTGWAVVAPGLPAFQETISGAVTNSTSLTIFYHDGHYGFAQTNPSQSDSSGTIDPWTYLYALQAELTLTESVRADNPFGIDFSGPSQASINITSDTPVILGGNIANPAGSTTISAPSITQSASATLTSDNLTLTSNGGVGTSAQPLDVSLTSGGVLNVQAGSQGVYLNLGSGALLGQVAAGNSSSGYGDVVLGATDSIGAAPGLPSGTVNVTGANVTLTSSDGAIGSSAAPLTIQAQGTVSASALNDIDLIQASGDLHVGQIASTSGNVYLDVPSGSIVDGTGTTWLSQVDGVQSQQIWSNLSLTSPTAAQNQAVTTFENTVDANYAEYWGLLGNGSVQNGVFTLNSSAVALYTGLAAAAGITFTGRLTSQSDLVVTSLTTIPSDVVGQPISGAGIPTGTTITGLVTVNGFVELVLSNSATGSGSESLNAQFDPGQVTPAQVQTYASSQYQSLVNFFAQVFSPDWPTLPEFQAYDPSFQYVATAQQAANLESNAGWTTSELMNPVADVAVDPQDGTPVGLTIPNISGVNVTLVTGGSIGQTTASITIPLADIQSGNLTTAQKQALADATAPGDIRITSAGVVVSPAAQVLISSGGALTATAGGSVTVQSAAPDITLNQVAAGGNVNITAPGSILSTGTGTQITTSGTTVIKAGTGTLGTSTSPLVVKTGGALYPYAPAGNTHLTVNGLTAIPVTLNAVEGQSLTSAAGSPLVVANFADSAAGGNTSEFTATIDWGDGTPGTTGVIAYNANTQEFAVQSSTDHVYTTTGTYTVTVTINDSLYSTSVVADSTAIIQVAELEADPSAPGGLMLAIGGTTGSDNIVVSPGAALGETMVTVDGSVLGPFSPTSRIEIFGQSGNDHYEVDAPLTVPVAIDANTTGTNSLTVVGDGASDAFAISNETITVASSLAGNTPEPITFQNVQSLTIDGGSGTDLFTIAGTAPGASTTVNTGTGRDTANITATSSPLTVNAQTGTDTINVQAIGAPASINAGAGNDIINVSSTAPAPAGSGVLSGIAAPLTISGGTGNTLNIGDAGDTSASTSTLTATTFGSTAFAPGGSVGYTGLGALNIAMGSGGNSFTVTNTAPGASTTINSGTGSDTVDVVATSSPLTVNTQTGTDTINVRAIAAPASVNAGGGNDVINVSSNAPASAGVLSGIAAMLSVDGGTGSSTLNISDAGDTTASTSTLTPATLTSTAFALAGGVDYTGLGTLNVSMGTGGNTFTVAGTAPAATTTINSGTGSDTVNIEATSSPLTINTQTGTDTVNVQSIGAPASINAGGGNDVINVSSTAPAPAGVLSGIAGLLSVNGGTGSGTLNISDAGDSTASTSTLTPATFTSTAFGSGGSLAYTKLGALNIAMGTGGNTFTVAGTAPAATTTINSGTGSDTVNIEATSSPLTVNTQAGTDTVNVQSIGAPAAINAGGGNDVINVSSTAPAPGGLLSGIAATLSVNGGTGSSTLNISDTGDSSASTSTLTPTAFTSTAFAPGSIVDYTSLATLNIAMGSGGNTFTVAGTAPGTMTTLNSGTGSDSVDVVATSSPLTVNTQTGTDTVNVQSIGAPATINAGGGNDTINVSSTAPAPTGVLSGIAATLTVNGGTGSSTLNLSDTADSTASTSTLTSTTFGSTAFGGIVDYTSLATLNIAMGSGGNAFTVAGTAPGTTSTVNSGTGSDTVDVTATSSPLTVNTQTGTDTVNLRAIGAPASINAGGGNDSINVSSTAPASTGVLSGIAGLLTVDGGTGSSTLNISDAADATASTSTLTPSTFASTAFAPGGSLSYSSIATLNLLLGSGGTSGNTLNISVPAGQNLPAATNLTGGSAGKDTLAANWASDFNGTLNEQGFAMSTVAVGGNFNGSMTADNSGVIAWIAIGGSLTASGVLDVVNTSDPASPTSPTGLLGDIGTMTVGGSIAGLVQVSGNITTLDVGPASTATTGGVNDLSGRVLVGGELTTASVSGDVSGSIEETLTINSLYLGGSLTQSGLISAVNMVNPALGNINTLTIGKDLDGTLIVSGTIGTFNLGGSLGYTSSITLGNLGSMTIHGDLAGRLDILGTLGNLTVDGGTPGTIEAGQIGTIGVHGGYGPIVARIEEAGIQRLIEAAVPSAPFPTPASPPAPTPAVSPAGVTFQYFYEGLHSPAVEGLSPSTNLANPQATIQVNNATGSTAADQFDLSLVTYSDTAKFNLARLDASGNSGVSGIRNVAVEGDVLTGVTASASAFFASDSYPAGVDLPQDHLAGVAVRDFLPNSSIRAATIQAVAFGSHAEEDGTIITGAQSTGDDAQETLAPGTLVVQANDTFRVPFADLAAQQSQLFVDTSPSHGSAAGSFDNQGIVLEVQSVVTANASGTANVVTQSNAARGAVTALVTLAAPAGSRGNSQGSVVQSIDLHGDGGSIQTALPFASASTITSTGPLGDLLLQGTLSSNVTAPSIFGSIIPQGGSITGTIQTTGVRTDPITGQTSQVPADLGRVYVNTAGTTPVLTSTIVRSFGSSLSGRIISRGNLLSRVVSDGGISGVIAVQGNVGTTLTYPSGQVVRINSGSSPSVLSNGPFSGQMIVLGDVIGDVTLNGGMHDGRIAVQGSVLGNLTIHGSLDGDSALVAGGSIGSTTYGTTLTVDDNRGIVAAVGAINAGKNGSNHAMYDQANDTPDEAVIDAIFSQGVSPLSTSDLFDQTTPEDLVNLTQMQVNLKSLTVKNGKLVL